MASAGAESGPHLAGEMFRMMSGLDMVHVPYRGQGPATADLLGGQVQVYFGGLPTTIEHIRFGKLRALGGTTEVRSQLLPTVPAIGEFLPGYEASFWSGFSVPANTPRAVIALLKRDIIAALADAKIRERLAQVGSVPIGGSADDFAKLIADETRKWASVIDTIGSKPE